MLRFRHRRHASLAGVLLLLAALASPATARSPGSAAPPAVDSARLELELSAIEWVPTRAALIARHGPGVAAALREIALQGRRALARNRALTVLRQFPSRATARLLERFVDRYRHQRRISGVALLELQQALVSYAAVAGKKALPRVTGFFAHASVDLRCSVAEAVRLSRSPRARGLLLARRELEPTATVRAEIHAELKRLGRRQRP